MNPLTIAKNYLALVEASPVDILYEDDHLVAINKPHGLLVHRSPIAKDAKEFALQKVRDYVKQRVYLVHRLDRKTSGVLLFAKNQESNTQVQQLFRKGLVVKTYHAIVRGHIQYSQTIEYPLLHEGKKKDCTTDIAPLEYFTISVRTDRYPSSRYTLLEVQPRTGRFHQIRKHLAHIRHPIIGDRPHGCNKQNKYWKHHHNITTMMLHAKSISFPWADHRRYIEAPYSSAFQSFLQHLAEINVLTQS